MGFIDKKKVKIICPSCNEEEIISSREKGSPRSVPYWTEFNAPKKFSLASEYDELTGPTIEGTKCLKCSCDALWNTL